MSMNQQQFKADLIGLLDQARERSGIAEALTQALAHEAHTLHALAEAVSTTEAARGRLLDVLQRLAPLPAPQPPTWGNAALNHEPRPVRQLNSASG